MKKNQFISGASVFILAMVMMACGGNTTNDNGHDNHENHEMHEETASPSEDEMSHAEVKFSDETVSAVFADYVALKTALVEGDADAAKSYGQKIEGHAAAGFEGQEAAKAIGSSSDIASQRTAFVDLTTAVEKLIDTQVTEGVVYKQYCPMAFDGKGGYWLSDQKMIRNPYYGDKMLKCGRVEKEIGV